MKASDQTEHPVQAEIIDYLRLLEPRGVVYWRNNVGRRGGVTFGKRGLPDILGHLPDGRFLAIEVKRPKGGRTSEEQEAFINKAAAAGAVAFVARNLHEVITRLEYELAN